MKKIIILICILILSGCTSSPSTKKEESNQTVSQGEKTTMKITINDISYDVTLEDNETVDALLTMLPMTITMNELNGNEKYHYLSTSLPYQNETIDTIYAGDVMLFGSDCLVIFYETFHTSYQYTRIGHIEDRQLIEEIQDMASVEVSLT